MTTARTWLFIAIGSAKGPADTKPSGIDIEISRRRNGGLTQTWARTPVASQRSQSRTRSAPGPFGPDFPSDYAKTSKWCSFSLELETNQVFIWQLGISWMDEAVKKRSAPVRQGAFKRKPRSVEL